MKKDLPNLDECRGAGDFATALTDIKAQITDLEAESAGRPFNDEQRAQFAALQKLQKDAEASKTELEERAAYVATLVGDPKRTEKPATRTLRPERTHIPDDIYALGEYRNLSSSEDEMRQALRDGAMKSVEKASFPLPAAAAHDAEVRANVQVLLDNKDSSNKELARRILVTGSPTYKRAFNKLILGAPLSNEEQRASMDSSSTGTTGGYAIPFYFDPTIIQTGAWTVVNPFRAACDVTTIVGTDIWHGVSTGAVTAARAAQNTAPTETAMTWAQPSIETQRVQAIVTYSIELDADRPDLATEMAKLISHAKDTEEEAQFAVGTGATVYPMGMISPTANASYTETDTATQNVLAIADIDAIEAALPIRHRVNAAWFMSRSILRTIQGFETTGGRLFGGLYYQGVAPLALNTPTGNVGLRLLGYPIYEVPSAPALVTGGGASHLEWCAFGDPKTYKIVDRAGMTVEVIPHLFNATPPDMPLGTRGLYAHWRNSAAPVNLDGMRRGRIHS